MSDGRTSWWAKDSAWWRREPVVELLEEVGLAGPCVVDWLACEAKAQNAGGRVKAGERTIARALGVELVTVGHALSHAVTVGLLDDFQQDGRTFTCRISGWKSEQEKALGARRKALQREKHAASHGVSRPVPECPPTGQDSTEQGTTPLTPQGGDLIPARPVSGRARDERGHEQRLTEWARGAVPEADGAYLLAGVRQARSALEGRGVPVSVRSVRWYAARGSVNAFGLSDEVRERIAGEFPQATTTKEEAA